MKGLAIGPCPSKLLDKRWKQKDRAIHKQKLRQVKSQVRDQYQSAPFGQTYQPGIRNGKKEALMEQRYTEIERENRILLEKMSNIMQNPKPNLYQPSNGPKKSLNREQRRRDLIKITVENQAILRRLQQKSATYSVERWNNEFSQQSRYRDMVCENPYGFGDGLPKNRLMTAGGQRVSGNRLDYLTSGEGQTGSVALPRIGSQSMAMKGMLPPAGMGTKYQTLGSQKGFGMKKGPIIRQAETLDENRIVLYKKGKQLGQGYYIVEISSNNTHLFIAAYDVESPESLLIELPDDRAKDILAEFNQDYESMANSLQVMNKRLVLLNPKFANQKRLGTAPVGGRPPLPGQGAPQQQMMPPDQDQMNQQQLPEEMEQQQPEENQIQEQPVEEGGEPEAPNQQQLEQQ